MRISDWSSDVCSSDLAEQLRNRLLRVPGVKKVVIIGERPERIFVNFSQERLATLGISPRERSEEHTSELQSLMRISYAVFCLKKKRRQKLKTMYMNLHT